MRYFRVIRSVLVPPGSCYGEAGTTMKSTPEDESWIMRKVSRAKGGVTFPVDPSRWGTPHEKWYKLRSPDRRIAGSPDRRIAGSPDRRIAGSPDRRIAGSPDRRNSSDPAPVAARWRVLRPLCWSSDSPAPAATPMAADIGGHGSHPHAPGLGRAATALLLSLPLVVGFAAGAQAAILVSNMGRAEIGDRLADEQTWRAQPFQTGTNVDAGYVLESVELSLSVTTLGPPTVSIRKDAGGDPSGRDLYTLSNPGRIRAGLNTFAAPTGAKLDANATYWVVVRETYVKVVRSNAGIDSGAAAGWTILPRHEKRENGRWVYGIGVMKIRVNGTERDDLVCDRTPRVRTAIVAKVAGISNCGDVTAAHLAAITGTLSFRLANIPSLKLGDFDGLTGLEGLDFYFNSLRTLPVSIFEDLTALTTLNLSTNRLTTLPAGIFNNNRALTTLDLGANRLTTLPAGIFDNNRALTWLELNGNRLTTLPAGIFDELTLLQHISLSDNDLTMLPTGIFDNNTALEMLHLAGNRLTTLPVGIFDNLTALKELSLRWNELTTLPESIFVELMALRFLTLDRNPGAPFRPVTNAGSEQTVSSGTTVSLSGAATGPWGNNVAWQWVQVDGATSNTVVTDGVTLTGATDATASFTAPPRTTTLHFRLTAIPTGDSRGIASDADWVRVTVISPPPPPGVSITQSDGSTTVTEAAAGRTDTYTVALDTRPTSDVRITVASGNRGAATVSPATLNFTPSNWSTAQTVTVTGVGDGVPSGNRIVRINHRSISGDPNYTSLPIAAVTVTVVDNDGAGVSIIASNGSTVVTEAAGAGRTDTYTVVLNTRPTRNVRIAVLSSDEAAATVSPASLTFLTTNWDTMQTVTVIAVDDNVDQGNRSATITHTTTSDDPNYRRITIPSVAATVADNDTAAVTITESGGVAVTEAAGADHTDTYTVVLDTVPSANVVIAIESVGTAAVTVSPASLRFTTTNWNTAQTVTVTGVDNNVDQGNRSVTITHTATSGDTNYNGISIAPVTATVVDGAPPAPATMPTITITGGPSPITEGAAAVFTVSRSGAVTAPLPVLLRVRETTTGGQDFVATAQEGVKTVTIPSGAATAPYTVPTVDDNTDEPDGMVTVTLNSSSAYLVGSPSAASVNVNDDDGGPPAPMPPAVTPVVSIMGGGGVTEGQAATFTVTAVPAPPPGEPISVNARISDSGNFVATGQSGSRSVTIDNSGMARFTVSTQNDPLHEDHGRITATVEGGSGYTPHASNGSASVRVEDDDPALMLSVSRLKVTEGGSASYTIALDTRPSGDVTVAISGDVATDLTLTPTSLTFTPSNWDRHQRVTITAPEDTDLIGAAIDLTHTASGPNYVGIIATVTATVVAAHPTEEAKAWQLRLGRTVSHQVVDALQDRLSAPPAAGLQLTVAGEAITSAPPLAEHEGLLSKALGFDPLTAQVLAEDSSFSFAPEQEGAAPRLAFWGQGAFSSFRGEEEDLSLDGSVTTLLLGADWGGQRWQAGAALSQSWGNGSYEGDNSSEGEITSTVTGLFPYGRYALTPRLGLWAVAGYGWGQLSLNPDGPGDDATPSTTMGMAALGMDGLLFDGGNEGITLSATTDVLTLKTTSEEVDGLESSEGSLSRLRLGIEAIRPFPLSNGASLLPSLALGIRQDSGDAESGFGLDLGAGILWSDPERGISSALRGHTLLAHGEEEFQEQGLAFSFSWEPSPSNRGPSLSLSHAMGATTAGGVDALLNPTTFEGLDAAPSSGQRFEAELAYGFSAHNNQLTLTPAVALALSPTSRNYSLLWSLAPAQADPWQLSLAGERQEPNAAPSPVEHSLKLTFSNIF